MGPWWVMIPIEDLTDVTLAIDDTDEDDHQLKEYKIQNTEYWSPT